MENTTKSTISGIKIPSEDLFIDTENIDTPPKESYPPLLYDPKDIPMFPDLKLDSKESPTFRNSCGDNGLVEEVLAPVPTWTVIDKYLIREVFANLKKETSLKRN
mgnify:CR=1 FL=1